MSVAFAVEPQPQLEPVAAEHIVIVLHDLPLGGTERIALRLGAAWAAAGRRVTLFVGALEGELAAAVDPAVEVFACSPPIPRGPGSRRRIRAALDRWLAAHQPDAVFFGGNFQWPTIPRRGPAHRRTAFLSQVSTPLRRHGRGPLRQIGYEIQTRRRLRPVDAMIALSGDSARHADEILGRPITRCIPLPALDDGANARLKPAEGRLILAAGRLVPEKGFDQALRAFAQLDDKTAQFVILGEGEERDRLEALAVSLGVADRFALPSYVRDITPWLRDARLLLVSSWYEGYAAVIVEALANGRPVVATDCTPAAGELLRGSPDRGRVAPLGDVGALTRALKEVLNAPPPCPEALAAAVARFRMGPIAEAYLNLFDTVVEARRSRL